MGMYKGLIGGFLNSLTKFPERPALEVDHKVLSYQELWNKAGKIAAAIQSTQSMQKEVAAMLAYRSETAYASILGILATGRGYVPLNPTFPPERTQRMVELSGVDVLVVGNECFSMLEKLLLTLDKSLWIIFESEEDIVYWSKHYPKHHYSSFGTANPELIFSSMNDFSVAENSCAYLLFTSGSTGIPKGVPVSHGNVRSYIEYIAERYQVNENDRFSQMFDMTFDLSVHDMFVAWERGACVCCVPEKYLMAPGDFINKRELTMWFSVPSVAMFMSGYRLLKPNSLPSLRYSLFCGEALSAKLAAEWQAAASHSIVENLYGPTETTIAICHYRWDDKESPQQCINGIVPIGYPFKGQQACVVKEIRQSGNQKEVILASVGESGELCLSGSQVTGGYLNNPEKTKEQYIRIPELGSQIWYRTGDLVKQDENGCLYFLGRIDTQIKIFGHRIELGEIDAVLRETAGTEMIISIAWPIKEGRATGIVAFAGGNVELSEKAIINACRKKLPDYMIPKRVYFLEKLPLNVNGKIDRLQLQKILEEEAFGKQTL